MAAKKHKTGLWILLVLLGLPVLLVLGLPTLLSTGPGRDFLVSQVNLRVPGSVELGGLHLSWRGDQSLQNLAYRDEQGQAIATVPSILVPKGLLALLREYPDVGDVVVREPRVVAPLPALAPPQTPTDVSPREEAARAEKAADLGQASFQPPDLQLGLEIVDAQIAVTETNAETRTVLQNLNVSLSLNQKEQPLTFNISGDPGFEEGHLEATGWLQWPPGDKVALDQVEIETEVDVSALPLEGLTSILQLLGKAPPVRGILGAKVRCRGTMGGGIDLANTLSIGGLHVPVKDSTDWVSFDDIQFNMNGRATLDSLVLSNTFLRSSFFTLAASGVYGGKQEGSFTTRANVDLDRLTMLLHSFNLMPPDLLVEGQAQASLSGKTETGNLKLEDVQAVVTDFTFRQGEKVFRDPNITARISGSADLARRRLLLETFDVITTPASIRSNRIDIPDWKEIPRALVVQGQVISDLEKVQQAAGDFLGLPEGMKMGGEMEATLQMGPRDDGRHGATVNGRVRPLLLQLPDVPPITEEVSINIACAADVELTNLELEKLEIESAPVSTWLAIQIAKKADTRDVRASGDLAMDLELLTPFVRDLTGADLAMTGKKAQPLDISFTMKDGDMESSLPTAVLEASVFAQTVQAFGFNIESLEVPASLRDGIATIDLSATVNQGEVHLAPSMDLKEESRVLTLPADSQLISGAQLTPAIADKLLALIHPVFKGAAFIQGEVNMEMDTFAWPVDPERLNEATFAGRFDFKDLRLGTSGFLFKILEAIKVQEREAELGDRTIEFACKNGRVTCSPLTIKVDEHTITLSGTMGLDKSLDYVAEVPMTRELAGSELYAYLEGTTFRIPVRGTVLKPVVDLSSFTDATTDLIKQAARKALQEKAGDLLKGFLNVE